MLMYQHLWGNGKAQNIYFEIRDRIHFIGLVVLFPQNYTHASEYVHQPLNLEQNQRDYFEFAFTLVPHLLFSLV